MTSLIQTEVIEYIVMEGKEQQIDLVDTPEDSSSGKQRHSCILVASTI